jgi:hypothetical protein
MKIRKCKRYVCEYCSKGFWIKEDCLYHEKKCHKNPVVKSCWNCGYFKDYYCSIYEKTLVKGVIESKEFIHFKNDNCSEYK